jgi:uncharacterized protein YggU (UPF0235/DUF167 family)
VKPGYPHTAVGGHHGKELVVKVQERAVDGAATIAAVRAVAAALGLRADEVTLASGASRKSKVLEIPDGLEERVAALLA